MNDGWRLVYGAFDLEQEPLREALCTLGNGRFATRGAAEESRADAVHYPGTYIGGGYSRLTSVVADRDVVNEDLVNFPNWLPISFRPMGGAWFGEDEGELVDYRQELDLRSGVLFRAFTVRDTEGRETRISARRIVHMGDPHLAGISQEVTPLNWSGRIEIRAGLDGSVTNWGVQRYRELRGDHIEVLDADASGDDLIFLYVRTKQSRLEVSLAARTRVWLKGEPLTTMDGVDQGEDVIWQTFGLEAQPGRPICLEKIVGLWTSRDAAAGDLVEDASLTVRRAPGFGELLASHRAAWESLWDRYDVEVSVAPRVDLAPHSIQLILRLHTFHMLQTASPHCIGLDVSVPARGLHGEAYRGHIFWDEMYLFPFYLHRDPELARSLLLYRYRRLREAQANAAADGRAGAMYPWQSGSSGREETQIIHLNPRSGAWDPDHSHLQRHVNAAIAMNVWSYVRTTGDLSFLARYGAEILLEIGRFWASMTSKDSGDKYEIEGVMGPDEFHEAYPGAPEGGLRNNAYTNVMAAWCIESGLRALELLDERERTDVVRRISLTGEETDRWGKIVREIKIPILPSGLIEQFEGYGELEELDWDAYRMKYGSIGRLDRILKAEGDSPDRYKLSKQADLCMLFYVFDREDLTDVLARAGCELTEERLRETIEYYRRRTSHGSTLSHLVFAAILDDVDRSASWGHFVEALRSDVDDVQGGTTPEGIHAAVMAGTVRHVLERFAGVRVTADRLSVAPRLPDGIERVRFTVRWRGTLVSVDVDRERVRLNVPYGAAAAIPVWVNGVDGVASPGEPLVVSTAPAG
jgi:trehalose/maltose hydrolase-like predicted phosphorylase